MLGGGVGEGWWRWEVVGVIGGGEERLMEDWRPIGGGEEGVEEDCG